MQYKNRNEVPDKYKWDLTSFFKDENEFKSIYEQTKKNIDKLSEYKGCTKNADKLYEFISLEVETAANWENLYAYSYLINDQELGNSKSIERKQKTEILGTNLSNNVSFFDLELLELTQEEYNNLYNTNTKLIEYKKLFDKIYRNKEHILTEDKEQIVNNLVQSMDHFEDIYTNLKNNEIDYGTVKFENEKIKLAVTNYNKIMRNSDNETRKKVYKQFNKKLSQYEQTFTMLLNSYVSMENQLAKIYNFNNSWKRKIFNENLSNKVYETLTKTVLSNLKPINRFFELKAHELGKDKLEMYDLPLELVKSNTKYSIEKSQEITLKAIEPLGKEYKEKFNKIYTNHYIDYCQYSGKQSGGYSLSTCTNDSRILMSFNENIDSISTIIHEGGHNVNHQYMLENNPKQYRENKSIVAEVASLTNECLLSYYLSEHGESKEEKLCGIANIIGVIVSNLYGAVREGKLEQDFYKLVEQDGVISPEFMNKRTKKDLKKFYGKFVKIDKYTEKSWILRSHYYMNYYLFSYAISISVATRIAKKIIEGDKNTLNKYLEFLKCGNDKWPSEAFEVLGINLEDKQVYQDACDYLDALIDKYYEILKKGE